MSADAAGSSGVRAPGAFLRRCARWDAALANAETVLLAILILGSLAASLVQIGLRNLGLPALPQTDTMVRRAVLWIAFIGASLAAFRGSHLAVDVADQVLPPGAGRRVSAAAHACAAAITILLTVGAARFVAAELAFAGPVAAAASAVMPLGFAVMTMRFLLGAARRLVTPDAAPPAAAMHARPTARTSAPGAPFGSAPHEREARSAPARAGEAGGRAAAARAAPSRWWTALSGKRSHAGGGT